MVESSEWSSDVVLFTGGTAFVCVCVWVCVQFLKWSQFAQFPPGKLLTGLSSTADATDRAAQPAAAAVRRGER